MATLSARSRVPILALAILMSISLEAGRAEAQPPEEEPPVGAIGAEGGWASPGPAAAEEAPLDPTDDEDETRTGSVGVDALAPSDRGGRAEDEAWAEAASTEVDADEEVERPLTHELQLGLRIGVGVPFVFALQYGDGPRCNPAGSRFCTRVGSALAELDLSFGVAPGLEITTMARVGLVGDFPADQNQLAFGLGVRTYIDADSIVKLLLGGRALIDITPSGGEPNWSDVDFGVRGEVGIQVDPMPWLGLFAQVGVNVLFLRAFSIIADVIGGVQGRLP